MTGGTGAIGSWVVRDLVEMGEKAVVFDAFPDLTLLGDVADKFTLVKGDITDFPLIIQTAREQDVKAVVHCAFMINADSNPPLGLRVNGEGTVNLLEAARLFDLGKFVFASSIAALGKVDPEHLGPTYKPVTEDHPCKPTSVYGITKLLCERYGSVYSRLYGLDFTALRFSTLYGPGRLSRHGDFNIIDKFIDAAFRGREMSLPTGGDRVAECTYNRDVARGLVLALSAKKTRSEVFHIGSGESLSMGEVVADIKEVLPGARVSIGPGQELPFTVTSYRLDHSRARDELGYQPKYSMKEGIEDYFRVLRQTGGAA